jgi:hypothetical protein
MPDTCIHNRRVSQSCPGCGNAPAAARERILPNAPAETRLDVNREGLARIIAECDAALVYRVTIPGNPGACKVNTRATPIVRKGSKHATMILGRSYKSWRAFAIACMKRAAADHLQPGALLDLRRGAVYIEVRAYWPRQHQQGEAEGLALGDVDAGIKACLDALRKPEPAKPPKPGKKRGTPAKPGAWVITDDAQAKRAVLEKHVDADDPRIEIEVRRAP